MPTYLTCLFGLAMVALIAGGPGPTQAEAPVHIYATDWGLTLKADGTGFYNDLARFLLDRETVGETAYEILPYRRAIRHFVSEPGACLYPTGLAFLARSGLIEAPETYVEGPPVLNARLHIFAQPGRPAISDMAAIRGKTLAYAMGASTPYMLKDTGAFFIAVADEVDKANLLISGRVDLMTAALPDAEFVFRTLGIAPAPYDPTFVIDRSVLSIVCHATDETRQFLDRLGVHAGALGQVGAFDDFFARQGLDPAAYRPAP